MINCELPARINETAELLHSLAKDGFRPLSRHYDDLEPKELPKELEDFAALLKAGRSSRKEASSDTETSGTVNGANMFAAVATWEMCWGDPGLYLALPSIGLGNAAVEAVATDEQKEAWGELFAAMAITEPGAGSDSAAIKTRAELDGDEYVINGEKIFVTDGYRCRQVVVWATLDPSLGKAAIKSFLVPKGTPGMTVVRTEKKLGIRASDTAQIVFDNCRIPKENLLGNPEIAESAEARKKAFGGVMQTFDNTRPLVAAQAVGVARAALDISYDLYREQGLKIDILRPLHLQSAVEAAFADMEAEYETARLLVLKATWMADNKQPNSMYASMAKAKAGRVGTAIALKCVELCGHAGYSKTQLLEKFARDAKIIDIYEGTQQIQQLIVARQVLGKGSSELK